MTSKPVWTLRQSELMRAYLDAYRFVTDAGYGSDIDWAEGLANVKPTPQYVLSEGAWVIVNSGFRYAVARKLWPEMSKAFYDFRPEMVNATSLTCMVFTPRPRARSSSSLIARSCRPNRDRLISQATRTDPAAKASAM